MTIKLDKELRADIAEVVCLATERAMTAFEDNVDKATPVKLLSLTIANLVEFAASGHSDVEAVMFLGWLREFSSHMLAERIPLLSEKDREYFEGLLNAD